MDVIALVAPLHFTGLNWRLDSRADTVFTFPIIPQSLSLLIDAENDAPKINSGLHAEVTNYGAASVKRAYCNWTKPNLNGWKDCLLEHSLQPVQQFAYTTGKGATDGALIIDATDFL